MGVGPGYRSSSGRACNGDCSAAINFRSRVTMLERQIADAKAINPDVTRWHILKIETVNNHLILEVLYPNCTNFEGRKLMMFAHGVTLDMIVVQRTLDPHFAKAVAPPYFPVARFSPDANGWVMARLAATFTPEKPAGIRVDPKD